MIPNKKIVFVVLTLLVLYTFSCNNIDPTKNKTYSFIDQNLQGVFSGESWSFVSGMAKTNTFNSGEWNVSIYDISYSTATPFDVGAYPVDGYKKLLFTIDKNLGVGLYELSFDFNSTDNFTVTFYDSDTGMNTISGSGAVELTNIDTINNNIHGRIHIWYSGEEEDFEVNGNIIIPYN